MKCQNQSAFAFVAFAFLFLLLCCLDYLFVLVFLGGGTAPSPKPSFNVDHAALHQQHVYLIYLHYVFSSCLIIAQHSKPEACFGGLLLPSPQCHEI